MINLLPPQAKRRYQLELVRRLVTFYSSGLVVVLAVFLGLLLSVQLYLDTLKSAVLDSIGTFESSVQFAKLREAERKIRSLNQQTKNLLALQQEISETSAILSGLFEQLPSGIFINSLSFDATAQKLSISGFSLSRTDVIAFKERVERLGWVVSVDSPPTNILKETNSPFNFTVNTKLK